MLIIYSLATLISGWIPESHAKAYRAIIEGRLKISEAEKVHFCKLGQRRSLRFAFPSWIRQVTGPNSSPNTQTNSLYSNTSQQLSSLAPIYTPAGRPNQSSTAMKVTAPGIYNNQLDSQVDVNSSVTDELFVLFGVDCAGRTPEFDQIDVTKQDDGISFQDLRKKYRELRGFWRYWLSVWRLNHCDFVQVGNPFISFSVAATN
jgi:hypothetical protein